MRKLLNTLYITTPESYLSLDGENIVILFEDREKFRMPFINIESIVCFSYMGASPALMGKCADNNIPISFLKPNGTFLARVTGKTKGSVLLRKAQLEFTYDNERCLKLSQDIIAAKIANSASTIRRKYQDRNDEVLELNKALKQLKNNAIKAYDFTNKDDLRGFEGANAKLYFGVFNDMITQQKKSFQFLGRSKRPPLDNVNCMLSYLYTLLSLEFASALETVGLDPYIGFIHEVRVGRASLALDMVEELRSYMVDRLVLNMINLKQVVPKDFVKKEGGGILFSDDGRNKIIKEWQEQKKKIIEHPVIGEKIEMGLVPYVQAQLLARFLRGDIDEYPPFICS